MALIQTVGPENAEGETKEIYDFMQKNVGIVPAPLELASASPWMLGMMWQSIQYFSQHPHEDFQDGSDVLKSIVRSHDALNAGLQDWPCQ